MYGWATLESVEIAISKQNVTKKPDGRKSVKAIVKKNMFPHISYTKFFFSSLLFSPYRHPYPSLPLPPLVVFSHISPLFSLYLKKRIINVLTRRVWILLCR